MRKQKFAKKFLHRCGFSREKVEVIKMKSAPEKPEDFALILENAQGEKNRFISKIKN